MAKKKSHIVGRWRITSMTEWDLDSVDEEVLGYFEFRKDGGDFQFGYHFCMPANSAWTFLSY